MAISEDDIRSGYPLPVYNYRVSVDGESVAFSEVSGLDIEFQTITYKHGLSHWEGPLHMPGMAQPVNISMKKGIVIGGSDLYDWLKSVNLNTVAKKDIVVTLCDETGEPVMSWKVIKAFPTKLTAPTFNPDTNEVAIESLDLMANEVIINYEV